MKTVAILAFAIWAAGVCQAQESHVPETHRVILRNGNMLDGWLKENTEKGILFSYSSSVKMFIKWGDIRSVEEIKIRTLHAQPKRIAPPSDSTSTSGEKNPGPTNGKVPEPPPNFKVPTLSPELQQKIDDFLDRLRATPRLSRGRYALMLDSMGTDARQHMAVRIELLEDDIVRWVASDIGRSGDRNLIPELRKRLNSKRPVVRSVAIQLLQELRDVESGRHVAGLLRDPDEGVRGAAAIAMPDLGDESSILPMAEMSRDPSGPIRKAALRACIELARRKGRLADVVTYWRSNAGAFNPAQKEDVAEAAGQLIPSLGGEGDPASVETRAAAEEFLLEFARDFEGGVRAASYRSLGKLTSPGIREKLVAALPAESHEGAAFALISTLEELRERAAIAELIERLGHSSEKIRNAAWSALKMITGEMALPADQADWRAWHQRQ